MKKMIAIVLALMLCVTALSVTAFAAWDNVETLAIVGEGIPGVESWKPEHPSGDMTEVSDGIWEKTLVVTAGTTMKFKIAGNDKWDDSCNFGTGEAVALGTVTDLPISTFGGDMTFAAEKDMTIKVTVDLTADAATILIAEVAAQGGETGGETGGENTNPGTGDMSMAAVSIALLAATAGLVVMGKKKEF